MADVQAAKRYAQAAFQIATATPGASLDQWRAELREIAEVLSDSAASGLLADRKVPVASRVAMVERMLDLSPLALNLARLLVSKGRSQDARAVSDAFNRMADDYEGIAHASVTTAVELTPEQLSAIEQQLSSSLGKRVRAVGAVDPAIIGGLVVRVGDKLVDGSVRTRLKRLRRELEGVR
ncbi:MAG: ATP synthase F1 subunit delta [Anaerolinea sp.]|nr:ATP synthase F1 subunit delta [Anaerolinea sp.]